MKFTPAPKRIEIEPLEKGTIFLSSETEFAEAGRVVQKGADTSDHISVGDILFFEGWGAVKITDSEKKDHYLVTDDPKIIIGYEQQ
jgi:hypothetical protein